MLDPGFEETFLRRKNDIVFKANRYIYKCSAVGLVCSSIESENSDAEILLIDCERGGDFSLDARDNKDNDSRRQGYTWKHGIGCLFKLEKRKTKNSFLIFQIPLARGSHRERIGSIF